MTIAVIGHLVRDRIIRDDGPVVEALGGIAYSLAALGALADENVRILPVCSIGHDLVDNALMEPLTKFSSIELGSMRRIRRRNKAHELVYGGDGYRQEINIGELPQISPKLFADVKTIDIALVNYIGGDEFPPRYIKWLKQRYAPFVYMDYHSLALGKKRVSRNDKRVRRYFRYNLHWREYTSLADVVQLNDYELKSIFPDTQDNPEGVAKSAMRMLATGPKAMIVTREGKELVGVWKRNDRTEVNVLPPKRVETLVDPTGCGDCFAAAFVLSYWKHRDMLHACRAGLEMASFKASFSGLGGFERLRRAISEGSSSQPC